MGLGVKNGWLKADVGSEGDQAGSQGFIVAALATETEPQTGLDQRALDDHRGSELPRLTGSEADLEMLLPPGGKCHGVLRAPEDPAIGVHTEHMGVLTRFDEGPPAAGGAVAAQADVGEVGLAHVAQAKVNTVPGQTEASQIHMGRQRNHLEAVVAIANNKTLQELQGPLPTATTDRGDGRDR